jgi:hypothetical protein
MTDRMTPSRDCRPPPNTPDGTVFTICFAGLRRPAVQATWRAEAWDWPYTSPGGQNRYTPDELSRAGWEIAEPPHDQ